MFFQDQYPHTTAIPQVNTFLSQPRKNSGKHSRKIKRTFKIFRLVAIIKLYHVNFTMIVGKIIRINIDGSIIEGLKQQTLYTKHVSNLLLIVIVVILLLKIQSHSCIYFHSFCMLIFAIIINQAYVGILGVVILG